MRNAVTEGMQAAERAYTQYAKIPRAMTMAAHTHAATPIATSFSIPYAVGITPTAP